MVGAISLLPDVTVIESGVDHVILSQANVVVVLWYGAQRHEVCRRLYDIVIDVAKNTGSSKISAVSVIRGGAAAPSPEVREALARLHEDPEGIIYRSALVFGKSGFVASIVRSVVIGLRQRASRRDGHNVFSEAEDAIAWATDGLPPAARGALASPGALLSEIKQHDAHRAANGA